METKEQLRFRHGCGILSSQKENGGNPMQLKFGENLRALRQNAGITQDRLAEYLGITSQAVSRWESGICYPDLEFLPGIASYFHTTVDALLGCDRT